MLCKIGAFLFFFFVFLLLFQTIDAKKRKQTKSPALTLSTVVEDLRDLVMGAWDALLDLIPKTSSNSKPKKKNSKKNQKKKKNKDTSWDLNYYMKSARKGLDHLYKSVSDSMGMLQLGRTTRSKEQSTSAEDVFFVEVLAAEWFEKITWGLVQVVSRLDERHL